MRLSRTLFCLLPILCGCGGVEIIFKSPVEHECGSAGLKGCPELTEGVILYIEGKEAPGKDKLMKGAAENAPAKVRKFAKALKELEKIPGASNYMKQVFKVIDILAAAKGGPEDGPPGAAPGAQAGRGRAQPLPPDAGPAQGGTVSLMTSQTRVPCGPLAAYGSCAWVVAGPLVLTDLAVDASCPAQMAAGVSRAAGILELPRWVAVNPRGLGSERSFVRAGESMFIGVQASAVSDPRCTLTWAGYRPNGQ